jgi:hypothetical protein
MIQAGVTEPYDGHGIKLTNRMFAGVCNRDINCLGNTTGQLAKFAAWTRVIHAAYSRLPA